MNPTKNFKAQFQHLLRTKPRYNLKQVQAENCDYSDTAVKSKNCYYCFGAFYCEDVFYGRYSRKCTDCVGVTLCVNCEGCVQCIDCANCYFVSYSQNCKDCSEVSFCQDCYSCQNCIGCVGLHRKQYCLFNEQLTEKEYKEWLAAINLKDEKQRSLIEKRVENLKLKTPLLATHHFRTEDSIGNNLSESREAVFCFDSFLLEDCLYAIETNANTLGCDLTVCFETELCYNCVQSPMNYNCNFLYHTDQCNDSEFCAYSKRLKNCFGCVALCEAEYHILNQPVSPEDYPYLVQQIREQLISNGDYNLKTYFVSDYEQARLKDEPDSAIDSAIG